MLRYCFIFLISFSILGCKNDKNEEESATDAVLELTTAHYEQKTKRPCTEQCTYVTIDVPVAQHAPVVADSINNKIFNTVRSIVYFGEKPSDAKTYEEITESFIIAYDTLVEKFPNEGLVPWEARVRGQVVHRSDELLNIKINNYMFTGGAHGYEGNRSLLFNLDNGTSLAPKDLFTDVKSFTALAENKFREKYKIPKGKSINATGLMFPEDKFVLPQNIFFRKEGILLYYNAYEAASYADGNKEVLIPYTIADDYLKLR